jgi:hypothetical protein
VAGWKALFRTKASGRLTAAGTAPDLNGVPFSGAALRFFCDGPKPNRATIVRSVLHRWRAKDSFSFVFLKKKKITFARHIGKDFHLCTLLFFHKTLVYGKQIFRFQQR